MNIGEIMRKQNLPDIDLVVYHNDVPVGLYKPSYIGMFGLHLESCSLNFDKGTSLEIEVLGPQKTCTDDNRIPVSVASNLDGGMGLRLESFEVEHIDRWESILLDIFSFIKSDKFRKGNKSMNVSKHPPVEQCA